MSDERLRELMAKMTEMSPEPPGFPSGIKKVEPTPPRRSGAWVFAVTALAVMAIALPFVFYNNDPDVGASDTTIPVDTTVPAPPSSTAPTTTIPAQAGPSLDWPIFLVHEPANSAAGNPALVAFYLNLEPGSDPGLLNGLTSPENILFKLGDLPVVLPDGFTSVVPEDVRILGKSFQMTDAGLSRVTLDMNREFLAGAGGLLADVTMLNQIIFTTLQFDVDEVLFTVEGEPVETFGSEGISLVNAVNRSSFINELTPIIVTDAVFIDSDGVLTARGWANVFEATVSWHIDAGSGAAPVRQGHVTADCGTGCWGGFEIIEDISALDGNLNQYELWIYTQSARDGSMVDVIRIPFSSITRVDN